MKINFNKGALLPLEITPGLHGNIVVKPCTMHCIFENLLAVTSLLSPPHRRLIDFKRCRGGLVTEGTLQIS